MKSNAQSLLPRLKAWFAEYVHQFSSDDAIIQENMDLKVEHTRRVCEAIGDIGRSLDLSGEDLCLAEASGLLHDIGRFEQFRQYRTFADYRSANHAELGVKVIRANRVLDGLEPASADIIVRVVGYHNLVALPVGEEERCLFFLKLLRDADKVDIWRVVTEYYQGAENNRNRTVELDLPDIDRISDPVHDALMNGRLARMGDLKTLHDFKLLQIGWIYDVNFPRTFQIVHEKEYLEKIRNALPRECPRINDLYERARAHLERNLSRNKLA
ncbi:MAG: HD domain-containing protein [Deltaproteobacteria bacterium]|nr:HD domain-containing protein [Deltaproteobacteria bacterium]